MSLFKKPRKNIRRRMGSNDEDDEFNEETPTSSVTGDEENKPSEAPPLEVKAPNIIKEKKKEKTKKTILSFEEDLHEGDDGEVFKVKKSSHSKKMMKLIDRERKKKKEVKREDGDMSVEVEPPADVELLSAKPPAAKLPAVLNGRAAEMAGVGDLSSDEEERHPKFSRPNNVKLLLERGHIPDAAMIHAARKRRQQARDNGGDYIPIGTTRNKPEEKSRLVREDDASDDEEEERIEMEVNKMAKEREKRRETFMAAQDDSDKRGEEEEWESQQIRKGVTGAQLAAVQQEALYGMYTSPVLAPLQPEDVILERKTEVSTPEEVVNRLRERLASLKTVREQHELNRDTLVADLLSTASDRERLEEEAPALADRFRLYQELRGYVTDLVECLDEKVPIIDALEQRVLALLRRRTDDMMERRRQDVRDQADELAPVSRSGVKRGREEDELRTRRAAEREGRRTRRRRAREVKASANRHQEGMSSDDEMTEVEVAAFRTQMQQVTVDRRLVFSDVVEDFSTVGQVGKRFERWRRQDWCAYQEAYVSLCLPKVLGPIIRLELVAWSPLEEGEDFERSDWFDALTQYGLGGSEVESQLRDDPDLLLIPRLVEKMMLPKIMQVVEAQWDPVSTSQTLRLVGLLNRLTSDYPSLLPTSRPLAQLFKMVVDKMKVAVDQDVFIPLFPKQAELGRSSGATTAFFERQFGSAVKLLRNFLAWHGLLSDMVLQEVGLGALLNRYLLTAVRNCEPADAAAKCNMIASTFPRWWFQPTTVVPQLQAFVAQVRHIVTLLDGSTPAIRDLAERLSHTANSLQPPTL